MIPPLPGGEGRGEGDQTFEDGAVADAWEPTLARRVMRR